MFDFPFGFGGLCCGMRSGDGLRVLTAAVIPNYSVACAIAYYGALLLAPPRSRSVTLPMDLAGTRYTTRFVLWHGPPLAAALQLFPKLFQGSAYLYLSGALFLAVCDDRLLPFLGFPPALCNLYGYGASPLFIVLTPLLSAMGIIALHRVIRPYVLHLRSTNR
ncbi:hypothetical protein V6N11_027627 [Hibiscus sabdariffa]|uniref:Uncharacterized protein n=2 Tax=Hibiscus sabdariffa TaxID=183260 RepID=A0ABR2B998_9ROSI